MAKRSVAVMTGSRADYGILRPVCRAIHDHDDLDLQVLVAGMHFLSDRGHTVDEIVADAYQNTIFFRTTVPQGHDGKEMADFQSVLMLLLSNYLDNQPADIMVVLGDHTEMLAAALVASYMHIPVVHLHGGEQSGGIDEPVRHMISRAAHYHFTASAASTQRLKKLGEDPDRIFTVGAPGLDTVLNTPAMTAEAVGAYIGTPTVQDCIVVVQHAVSTEWTQAGEQIGETLAAVNTQDRPVIAIYPNNDPGGAQIITELERAAHRGTIITVPTLPHAYYINLMRHAAVLVGNSSSGIIEASSLSLPVVNVGTRQAGRERAANVIDVPCRRQEITAAINRALYDRDFAAVAHAAENPYGTGRSSPLIANLLATIDISPAVLQKRLVWT